MSQDIGAEVDLRRSFPDLGADPAGAWRGPAEKALRGKPIESLLHTTADGIELEPIYWDAGGHAADIAVTPGWDVRAVIESGGLTQARQDIAAGATSLWIRAGTELTAADIELLGAEVPLDIDHDAVPGAVGDVEQAIDGWLVHASDRMDDATELAVLISTQRHFPADAELVYRVALGPDIFGSISKLRALRVLVGDRPARVHAIMSPLWVADCDVWTNMIRAAAVCFAAAVGGADIITLWPWDRGRGSTSAAARRMAITTHAVAARESHLGEVLDPAAGSYLVERWTAALVEAARARVADAELWRTGVDIAPKLGVSIYPNPEDPPAGSEVQR